MAYLYDINLLTIRTRCLIKLILGYYIVSSAEMFYILRPRLLIIGSSQRTILHNVKPVNVQDVYQIQNTLAEGIAVGKKTLLVMGVGVACLQKSYCIGLDDIVHIFIRFLRELAESSIS